MLTGRRSGSVAMDLLSELPNLMAKVSGTGSLPSEKSAATFQTQDRSDPTLGESFISAETEGLALSHR